MDSGLKERPLMDCESKTNSPVAEPTQKTDTLLETSKSPSSIEDVCTFDDKWDTSPSSIPEAKVFYAQSVAPMLDSTGELYVQLKKMLPNIEFAHTGSVFDLLLFLRALTQAKSFADYLSAFFQYLRTFWSWDQIAGKLEFLKQEAHRYMSALVNNIRFVVKAEGKFSKPIELGVAFLRTISRSRVFSAVRDVVSALVAMRFFGRITASRLRPWFNTKDEPKDYMELIEQILSSLGSILNCGEEIFTTDKSVLEVLTSDSPLQTFENQYLRCLQYEDLVYHGLPMEGFMDSVEYADLVKETIASGELVLKSLSSFSSMKKSTQSAIVKLQQIHARVIRERRGRVRAAPLGVVLYGAPGIGKATVIRMITRLTSEVHGRTDKPEYIYSRNMGEDFWSGYDGSQPYLHFPEVGSLHLNIASKQGDPAILEILPIIDNLGKHVNMASLDDKGKMLVDADLVIIDTNEAGLNLSVTTNNPAAYHRRFLRIALKVKPEFRKEGSAQIDSAKSFACGNIVDRWLFTVSRSIAMSNTDSKEEFYCRDVDAYEFSEIYAKILRQHIENQQGVIKLAADYAAVPVDPVTKRFLRDDEIPLPQAEGQFFSRSTTRSDNSPDDSSSEISDLEHEDLCVTSLFSGLCRSQGLNPDEAMANMLQRNEAISREIMAELHGIPELHDQLQILALRHDTLRRFITLKAQSPPSWRDDVHRLVVSKAQSLTISFRANSAYRIWRETMLFGYDALYLSYDVLVFFLFCLFLNSIASFNTPSGIFIRLWSGYDRRLYYARENMRVRWSRIKMRFVDVNPRDLMVSPYKSTAITAVIAVISIAVALGMMRRIVKPEGQFVSSSQDRTPEQIDEAIGDFETHSGAKEPRPRSSERPRPKVWDAAVDLSVSLPLEKVRRGVLMNHSDEIMNVVNNNVWFFEIKFETDTVEVSSKAMLFGIKENIAVINSHNVPSNISSFELVVARDRDFTRGVRHMIVEQSEVYRHSDFALLRVRSLLFKDISSYLSPDYLVTPPCGLRGSISGQNVVFSSVRIPVVTAKDGCYSIDKAYAYECEHKNGMCATPLYAFVNNVTIVVGIHAAGLEEGSLGYSISFDPEFFALLSQMSLGETLMTPHSEGPLRLPVKCESLVVPSPRNPISWFPAPSLDIFGQMQGVPVIPRSRSSVTNFPGAAEIAHLLGVSPFDENGNPKFLPPPMRDFHRGDQYISPMGNFVCKVGVIKKSLQRSVMLETSDMVNRHIISELKARGVAVTPLPMSVACNGHSEDFYLRSMKKSTSGGYSFPGRKEAHTSPISLPFAPDGFAPDDDVKEQVLEMLEAYARGETANPLVGIVLKDEARAYSKVIEGKTRPFCMSDFPSTIVQRMYLAPLYTLLIQFGEIFHASVGINMHSPDVTEFVESLLGFSNNFMELDYSGFDTAQIPDIAFLESTLMIEIARAFGYNEEALRITRGILTDCVFPVEVMEGCVFRAHGHQPSGKYGTAESNCVRNLFMLAYFWTHECSKYGFSPDQFWQFTLHKTYGDDLLSAIKPEASWFNTASYKAFCQQFYGIKVTDAQKGDDVAPYKAFTECSFLKRHFWYDPLICEWKAPLEMDSIYKSIALYIPSRSVSAEEQWLDSSISALRELALHLTEEDHNVMRKRLARVMSRYVGRDVAHILQVYPTYTETMLSMYE